MIEKPIIPIAPAELLVDDPKPEAPINGELETILNHAIDYGAWSLGNEQRLKAWQEWYRKGLEHGHD